MNLVQLEEQAEQIEEHLEEKARLLKQKNELTNLMKTVENNIEPRRYTSMVGNTGGLTCSNGDGNGLLTDELLDFDSGLPDPSKGPTFDKEN